MYANLKRYDLEEIRGCGEYDHVMSEQACGEYVKFADVLELLNSSHNSAMDAIAILQERFCGDYEKFSDFDNISLVVDTLAKLQQHQ